MLCRSFHLKCRVGRQRAIKLKHIFKSICKLTRHPFFILTKDATNLLFSLECRGVPTPKARAPFMVLNSWFSKTKILGKKLRGGAKTLGWISRPNHFIWKLSNPYLKKVLPAKFRLINEIFWFNDWPPLLCPWACTLSGDPCFNQRFIPSEKTLFTWNHQPYMLEFSLRMLDFVL